MEHLKFRDDIFENPDLDWVHERPAADFTQRYLRDAHPIYCETVMTVRGSRDIEATIALISGRWDWWAHGRNADFRRNEDGSSDQVLSPVWWFLPRLGLHVFPPENLPGLKGQRIPVRLTRDVTGSSSMDVYPGPTDDALTVRGRFHGVEYTVPFVSNWVARYLHLSAESGTMPIPFPKGTGWVGLRHGLEGLG